MADKKYARNQLVKKTVAELTSIWVDDEGLDITDLDGAPKPSKADLIAALLDIDAPDEDELEDEVELDDEEEELDEEEDLPEEDEEDLELPEEEEDDIEEEAPKPAPKKSRSKAKKTDDEEGSGTLAAKQVATLLGTEAKTLRQFFRSPASTIEAVGSGGRYEFNESDLPTITKEFEAWKAGHASRGNKRADGEAAPRKSRSKKTEAPIIEEIEELEIEDLEEEELELEDED